MILQHWSGLTQLEIINTFTDILPYHGTKEINKTNSRIP